MPASINQKQKKGKKPVDRLAEPIHGLAEPIHELPPPLSLLLIVPLGHLPMEPWREGRRTDPQSLGSNPLEPWT